MKLRYLLFYLASHYLLFNVSLVFECCAPKPISFHRPCGFYCVILHRVVILRNTCHVMEKEMATHSSILAWRIPGTEEPDGLSSMGSHRVGHDRSDLAGAAVCHVIEELTVLITQAS